MTSQTLYRRNFLLHLQKRLEYDRPVLLKEPAHEQLTAAQISQIHNEYLITRQLAHVSGVRPVYRLEGTESHPVLLLEYIPGQNLAELNYGQSLSLIQKLQVAVRLSGILEQIHDAGVMHRDISSGNIMVADDTALDEPGGVTIIDFGLAMAMRQEELTRPVVPDAVAGSLVYISPEQTGRTNRPVDYRTDLYSLGVTLYELLGNRPPFEASDPLEMIHHHLAQSPEPLSEINVDIPQNLSDIVLKLLSKNADDRYLSARGLGADLVLCLNQLQTTDRIASFELGRDDFGEQLVISHSLYGRQSEIEQLVDTYDQAAEGTAKLLFIAGYSGVGKTSLVHEIQKDVLLKGGIFAEGKFDQLKRTVPYSAWAQSLANLVNGLLAESGANLAGWRETILEVLGDYGQILIDVVPFLEYVIGPQPEVPQLGGIENQNRFNYYFNRFISSLATPEHPLVVFLDDMQWVDAASLNLIEALFTVQTQRSFLLIGAYRDNEVGSDHPLLASQEKIREKNEQFTIITLKDLSPDNINHMLADTLHLTVADCHDISQVLVDKTAGNPFYFRQQLYALESEGLLMFDRKRRRWEWEPDLQQRLQAQGSVVDLMLRKIQTLPVNTQYTLSMAAFIGSRFELSTLDTIIDRPQSDIIVDLNPALQAGLIVRSSGHYIFAHDRIQEASFALIPETDQPQRQLDIGRLLLADTLEEQLDEEIFAIVGHLNAGRQLIEGETEKTELAALNLRAGQKAKAASAFEDARQYIEIGVDLLGLDSWQDHYSLTLSLHNARGELACFTGQYDQVALTANLVHANANAVLDQVRMYATQIDAATILYDFNKSVEIGLDILEKLGFEIPVNPTPEDYRYLIDRYIELLTERPANVVASLPEMMDERALAVSEILASELTPTYISKQEIHPTIGLTGAILSLESGYNDWSPEFFAVTGNVFWLAADLGTPSLDTLESLLLSRQMYDIVLEMLRKPIYRSGRTKILGHVLVTGAYCFPIESLREIAQTCFQSGFETGDLLYGGQGALHCGIYGLAASMNLHEYQSQFAEYCHSLLRLNQRAMASYLSIFVQGAANLAETLGTPHRLVGSHFDEDAFLPAASAANDVSGRHLLFVVKLMLSYHFNVDSKLFEHMGKAEKYAIGAPGLFTVSVTHLFSALVRLRLYPTLTLEGQKEALYQVDHSLQLMEIWSRSVPSTYQPMYDLIAAEKARVIRDLDGALSHYKLAIHGAREGGFTHYEALANELFACFWAERDDERFASLFMREAHALYLKWGAVAKAEHLEICYPELLVGHTVAVDESRKGVIFDQMSGDLDLKTVLKASQAFTREIELDKLLDLLMTVLIENSGAQSGYLLLPEDGQWMIVAQANLESSKPQVDQPLPVTESDQLSQAIVNYVAHTQEAVLLDDASRSGEFVNDPYLQRHRVKSLFCTPLFNQGRISALLYLENNLTTGIFAQERVEMLQLLSSQMAISIDNARTHNLLKQLLEERSKALSFAETQIRSLFENSPLGIAMSSPEGQVMTVNKALLNMLRISEEELMQRSATDFYADPADRKRLMADLQEAGFVQEFGIRFVRHDGSSFFGSIHMSRLLLEDTEVLLSMVEDVTAEITAEHEAAVLEERERLARELHDAVTQTLFTASVLAQTSPRLLETNPAVARHNLVQLDELIRGALAEMRTLLLELRPNELREKSLAQLFNLLAESTLARAGANVIVNADSNCSPPQDVAIALYRIAQESLNNVAKHAMANEVVVNLSCDTSSTLLSIKDDGRGFDPSTIPTGHLGVSIMRSRAQEIGASIRIDSKIGRGTQVSVSWSAAGKESASGDESEHA